MAAAAYQQWQRNSSILQRSGISGAVAAKISAGVASSIMAAAAA